MKVCTLGYLSLLEKTKERIHRARLKLLATTCTNEVTLLSQTSLTSHILATLLAQDSLQDSFVHLDLYAQRRSTNLNLIPIVEIHLRILSACPFFRRFVLFPPPIFLAIHIRAIATP
jgi:hypothetical protein